MSAATDLDATGEGRRQLAQVVAALSTPGISAATVADAIRETLLTATRTALDPCTPCGGTGLDPTATMACSGCSGYGTLAGRGYVVHVDIDQDGGVAATGTPGDLGRWLLSTSTLAGDGESIREQTQTATATIHYEEPIS